MGKVITVANQKGGVGKTTTSTSLAGGLFKKGYRTLLVDTDPQSNASDTYGVESQETVSIYSAFTGESSAVDSIQKTQYQGDILPGDLRMSAADMQFTQQGREYILQELLQPIIPLYDYIIIDTPPTLGIVTINALTAADSLLIPMLADRYSLQGIRQLAGTIKTIRKYSNPNLVINGILLTRFNGRTVLNRDVREAIEELAEAWNTRVFKTAIRQSVSLQESQTQQESIFTYAPDSTTGNDYAAFVEEFLSN